MAKKRQKQRKDPYSKYKNGTVMIYMMAMMLVYVLYCKHGYVNYDYEKEVVLLIITGLFLVAVVGVFLASFFSGNGLERIKKDIMPTDYLVAALVIAWIVSYIGAVDKDAALWGDYLRRMGLLFYLSFLLAFLVISHWGAWNRKLTVVFLIMCVCEWMMQILQYFGIDLFNWQMDHQYPYLIGTLGAVDQNAYFDGIVLTLIMSMFILESEKEWKAIYGIAVFVGFIAGVHSNADSFAAAFGMGFVVMFGYCLYRGQNMLYLAIVSAIIYAAAWVQRICHHFNTYPGTYDRHGVGVLESMIYSDRWMLVAAIGLAVLFLLAVILRKMQINTGKKLLYGYLSILAVGLVSGLGAMVYANVNRLSLSDNSLLTKLVVTDQFGNSRGYVWNRIIYMMKQSPWTNKLFGHGFGSLSQVLYAYNPDMDRNSGADVWADGHNTIMDLLASSGVIGVLLFVSLCIALCAGFVHAMKKNERMIVFLALLMAYAGAALINSNLNVNTPIIFMLLAMGNNYAHHIEKTDER